MELEVKQKRLEAMQSIVTTVVKNISEPLAEIGENITGLQFIENLGEINPYIKIIVDNYKRILNKFDKIRSLNQDKTVTYIKGIKMTNEFDGHATEENGNRFWTGFWSGIFSVILGIFLLSVIWISILPIS